MGLGAVLHTLNPRLFATELEYIVNHAQDQYIFLDLTFVSLIAQLQDNFRGVKGFVVLTDREHMPRDCTLHNVLCYEDILQVRACMLFRCSRHLLISKLRDALRYGEHRQVHDWPLTGSIAQHFVLQQGALFVSSSRAAFALSAASVKLHVDPCNSCAQSGYVMLWTPLPAGAGAKPTIQLADYR